MKERRWHKDVGLGFKTPPEAINGTYIGAYTFALLEKSHTMTMSVSTDKKCPFTSEVSIRGRILTGRVISTKMTRTIIIRRDYLHYVPKYSTWRYFLWASNHHAHWRSLPADRYEKRHKNLAAHVSPAFRVEPGDVVTVGQSRAAGGCPDVDHERLR